VFSGGLIVVVLSVSTCQVIANVCGVRYRSRLCNIDPRSCRHSVVVFGAFREVAEWDTPLTISTKSYTRASFADTGRNTEQDLFETLLRDNVPRAGDESVWAWKSLSEQCVDTRSFLHF
jgi:hypothetical protein